MSVEPSATTGTFRLTVLGTSDLHCHVLDWDYIRDRPYADAAGNHTGLARLSTLISAVRSDQADAVAAGRAAVLTVDNGDTLEGNPLAYYYARIATDEPHPLATAMNVIGFDAAALGNHEFNYGLEVLERFRREVNHPMLCANAFRAGTSEPYFQPYLLRALPTCAEPLKVGLLGLITPGTAIWDRSNLAGRLSFEGIVEQARSSVAQLRGAGADVVVVLCHSGLGPSSSYGDALPWPENAAARLAEDVAGIDAILAGHAHVEVAEEFRRNSTTGRDVLLTEPLRWGMRLSVIELDLTHDLSGWQVCGTSARLLNTADADADPRVTDAVSRQHEAVRTYVNAVIATSTEAMSAARSRFEASAVVDLVNHVEALSVRRALTGTDWARLPVLGVAAASSSTAGIPAGPVTIRDLAGVYNYDNTLVAVLLRGSELRSYLEHAAGYFRALNGPGPVDGALVTNAPTALAPSGTPDYNYDMVSGLDQPLYYDIDLGRPVGSRITRLQYGENPVSDDQQFVLALNNYRQAGGGDYPAVRTAPVVYDELAEIRQLIIDWAVESGSIEPSTFSHRAWRLVVDGVPVQVNPD